MRKLLPKAILVLLIMMAAVWAIIPPEKTLRLGKDLRGGASLIYSVQLKPGDDPNEVISQMIVVLKERVDPDGLSEISMVQQGRDRIEITMPLPDKRVKALKQAFEEELRRLEATNISPQRLERIVKLPASEREGAITSASGRDVQRAALLSKAALAYDTAAAKRAEYNKAVAEKAEQAVIDRLVAESGEAAVEYDAAKAAVMQSVLSPTDVRRALLLSDESRGLIDNTTNMQVTAVSPRRKALERLTSDHPAAAAQLSTIVKKFEDYAGGRRLMDDPADLVRQLKGAGVLNFRITVPTSYDPAEVGRLRTELRERGPRNVKSHDVGWYKVNQIRNWYESVQELRYLEADPVGFFASRGYVAAEYDGEYYLLCFDTRGTRLTQAEGQWSVSRAHPTVDERGFPAIGFEMDAPGGVRLGELTRNHVNESMAILLDDQVYTAPRLESAISNSGRITGNFPPEELRYIIRVLSAGSLQAKLSPEPLSIQSLGPDLGADNLRMGFNAGVLSAIVVAAFMVFYYFSCGLVAVIGLICNVVLLTACMALNKAAFTMPGIAGLILTFGMAVDSNVLIYERMREEILRGADLKTAVRLGHEKALSSIMDGNITNLIVCVVLAEFGTQEVRGFAITMGIGVVTTLFSALVINRLIFDLLVGSGLWKKASMLPLAIPALQRALTPNINWLRMRWVFFLVSGTYVGLGVYMVTSRGVEMLDNEFRGGTEVTLQFKEDPATGTRATLTRKDVEDRVVQIGRAAAPDDPLHALANAEIIPINPAGDGVTSDQFKIKTVAENQEVVKNALTAAFQDYLDAKPPVFFAGSQEAELRKAPVYRIAVPRLGENIDRPDARDDVGPFVGGVAIVLADLNPPQRLSVLQERMRVTRPEFAGALARTVEVRALEGTDEQVRTAVVLVRDETVTFLDDEARFDRDVAEQEWSIVRAAYTETRTPASVQNFSAAIAQTFRAKALTATLISFLLIAIYIWVRFKSLRYSMASIVGLIHNVLTVLGLVALCDVLYENPATRDWVAAIGILPFKIDLNLVAALLTIVGYSLNDTIVIMDRIRENRGKLPYASADVINASLNQTLSRTVITGGTTMFSTLLLFLIGGEGVRAFSFALFAGLIVGTYSSVAVAAPLVWSRKMDRQAVAGPG